MISSPKTVGSIREIDMLGHTTPEMTLKRYTRYIKKENVKRGLFFKNKIST